ncbi:hypothetical protein ACFQ3C_11800 [Seohaeicola saemankumensis]|uniref:Uncharacterized protein n=1 Tax=Seohaeicola saemankumensis TaxID=481181 RepID=A0ABW3TF45_9RHOB
MILLLIPAVMALSLCLLQPGRQAAVGIGIVAVVLAVLWFAAGGNRGEGLAGTYALMAAPGVALAGLAHLTHRVLGPRLPVWGYAVAGVLLLIGLSALLRALAGN